MTASIIELWWNLAKGDDASWEAGSTPNRGRPDSREAAHQKGKRWNRQRFKHEQRSQQR
jgi:hypothetical protein